MEISLESDKKGRVYGGVSPEARAAERRAALLRAGTQLFGTLGFRRTTVRAICQEARLNDRYFYAAFDSTEALLCAVYLHYAERLRREVREVAERTAGGLDARVTATLEVFFELLRDTCGARVLMFEVMGVSPQVDAVYQSNLVEFSKVIMEVARPREAETEEERAYLRIAGIALVGALINVGMAWMLTGYREPVANMIRSTRTVLFGALRHLAEPGDL
jgi:AcrR family transcriptional regulator